MWFLISTPAHCLMLMLTMSEDHRSSVGCWVIAHRSKICTKGMQISNPYWIGHLHMPITLAERKAKLNFGKKSSSMCHASIIKLLADTVALDFVSVYYFCPLSSDDFFTARQHHETKTLTIMAWHEKGQCRQEWIKINTTGCEDIQNYKGSVT